MQRYIRECHLVTWSSASSLRNLLEHNLEILRNLDHLSNTLPSTPGSNRVIVQFALQIYNFLQPFSDDSLSSQYFHLSFQVILSCLCVSVCSFPGTPLTVIAHIHIARIMLWLILLVLSHSALTNLTSIIPILQMRKLRHEEVKNHQWQSWDSNQVVKIQFPCF